MPLQPGTTLGPYEALVHDSKLTVNDPNPEASHRPILYDSGRPNSVIWFRTLHATTPTEPLNDGHAHSIAQREHRLLGRH